MAAGSGHSRRCCGWRHTCSTSRTWTSPCPLATTSAATGAAVAAYIPGAASAAIFLTVVPLLQPKFTLNAVLASLVACSLAVLLTLVVTTYRLCKTLTCHLQAVVDLYDQRRRPTVRRAACALLPHMDTGTPTLPTCACLLPVLQYLCSQQQRLLTLHRFREVAGTGTGSGEGHGRVHGAALPADGAHGAGGLAGNQHRPPRRRPPDSRQLVASFCHPSDPAHLMLRQMRSHGMPDTISRCLQQLCVRRLRNLRVQLVLRAANMSHIADFGLTHLWLGVRPSRDCAPRLDLSVLHRISMI